MGLASSDLEVTGFEMKWLMAPEYWLARLVLERLLGFVYLVAFVSVFNQFTALAGEHGLAPAPPYLRAAGFRRTPTIFCFSYSDRFARALAAVGVTLSAAVVSGVVGGLPLAANMAVWAVLWALYLSFVNAGQAFFGFVWETLLLEAGFLAIFLGDDRTAPLWPVILLLRWLLWRLEVGAGLIKIRNDPAWRDLTALNYHHETQPIPGPFSWWFHHLPKRVHRLEVAGNHFAQLVVPFALFAPQPAVASAAGATIVATQVWLMLSGNFAWLNALTIILAVSAFDNRTLSHILPMHHQVLHQPPGWFTAAVLALTAAMIWLARHPLANMVSSKQVMNASYNPLHISNTYGLFGHITQQRLEIILEGTDDPDPGPGASWKPYEFKAKPGDPRRRPRQVAPYHLRLDWLMWFAALSPLYAGRWFTNLVAKLLAGDEAILRLMAANPFADRPPRYIRALLYRYRFSTAEERRRSGQWWERELLGRYLPAMTLQPVGAGRDPTIHAA